MISGLDLGPTDKAGISINNLETRTRREKKKSTGTLHMSQMLILSFLNQELNSDYPQVSWLCSNVHVTSA